LNGRLYWPFRGYTMHPLLQTHRDNFLNTCYVYHSYLVIIPSPTCLG
jgi:hypothetical protein